MVVKKCGCEWGGSLAGHGGGVVPTMNQLGLNYLPTTTTSDRHLPLLCAAFLNPESFPALAGRSPLVPCPPQVCAGRPIIPRALEVLAGVAGQKRY